MSVPEADVMVDLETMGTDSDAAIVAIGAVAFTDQVIDTFYVTVNLQSALDSGASVTGDTIMWWLRQSVEAREALQKDTIPLEAALAKFSLWCGKYAIQGMWGNGATFDNVILSNAYKAVGSTPPWPYWADRCFRTVKAGHPELSDFEAIGHVIQHHALSDANWQAQYLLSLGLQD